MAIWLATTGRHGHVENNAVGESSKNRLIVSLRQVSISISYLLSEIVRRVLSDRGLILLAFLCGAFLVTWAPWLRPPLSADLRGAEISLGLIGSDQPDLLTSVDKGKLPLDSPCCLIMMVFLPSMVTALHKPCWAGVMGGTLLCGTMVTHAILVANQPELFELLEQQHAQRQNMAAVASYLTSGEAVSDRFNGRISGGNVSIENRHSLRDAWRFLLYGTWLIPLAGVTVLFGSSGSLNLRVGKLFTWSLFGLAISLICCGPRLQGEWHWQHALRLMQAGNHEDARHELARGLQSCPALGELQRTWYLAGKLDFLADRVSPQRSFFQAIQCARQNDLLQAASHAEPLLVHQDLAACVRSLASDIWTKLGRQRFLTTLKKVETLVPEPKTRTAATAVEAWRQALAIDRTRLDCLFYLALAHAQSNSDLAHVATPTNELLSRVADRALRADILSTLGDVFFEAGEIEIARHYYQESKRVFELPKDINFRARRGLLGV